MQRKNGNVEIIKSNLIGKYDTSGSEDKIYGIYNNGSLEYESGKMQMNCSKSECYGIYKAKGNVKFCGEMEIKSQNYLAAYGVYNYYNSEAVVIQNASIIIDNRYAYGIYNADSDTIEIENTTIKTINNSGYSSTAVLGINNVKKGIVNFKSGQIVSSYYGIYNRREWKYYSRNKRG